MGCRMSLKVHVLHAHLDEFKNNMGMYSEDVMDFKCVIKANTIKIIRESVDEETEWAALLSFYLLLCKLI